jgi:hypothetical protein
MGSPSEERPRYLYLAWLALCFATPSWLPTGTRRGLTHPSAQAAQAAPRHGGQAASRQPAGGPLYAALALAVGPLSTPLSSDSDCEAPHGIRLKCTMPLSA